MTKIVFLSPEHHFVGHDVRDKPLGGIETSTILLAEALSDLGHQVEVHNRVPEPSECRGVSYQPFQASANIVADLIVCNNSARYLRYARASRLVVWQHNKTSLSRAFKRREIVQLLLNRPELVTLSTDAKRNTPWFLPYGKRYLIPHAIEPDFLNTPQKQIAPIKRIAVFASKASRNLDYVINLWKQHIHLALPDAEFHICGTRPSFSATEIEQLRKRKIIYLGPLTKAELAQLMSASRVLLYPGHVAETGCQVALQAIASGLPIVTRGIGCLKNQVAHGNTGFVCTDDAGYVEHAIQLLTDNDVWLSMHAATLRSPWITDYTQAANSWCKKFN